MSTVIAKAKKTLKIGPWSVKEGNLYAFGHMGDFINVEDDAGNRQPFSWQGFDNNFEVEQPVPD